MEILIKQTKLALVQGDITQQTTDAIVNAANPALTGGGGVDGAIHRAGGPTIPAQCIEIVRRQGKLPAGEAVITTGGNLPAKYVIHTVGPIWNGGNNNEAQVLASAYQESLRQAEMKKLTSISFPSISTGAYRYPPEQAAKVALEAVISFIKQEAASLKEVRFVLFNTQTYEVYADALKAEI